MYDKYGASPGALAPQNRPLWLPGEGGVSTLQRNTAETRRDTQHEGTALGEEQTGTHAGKTPASGSSRRSHK